MFNHGVGEVFDLLKDNVNPEAIFNVHLLTAFSVVVKGPSEPSFSQAVHQLVTSLSPQVKSLIINLKDKEMSASELQLVTNLSPQSKRLFRMQYINPGIEVGLVGLIYPDTPRHPKQKYYLTEIGLKVLGVLLKEEQNK